MRIKNKLDNGFKLSIKDKVKLISSNSINTSLGFRLVTQGRVELVPFKAINFKGWDDWEQDPLKNRSWQWRLNWLSFLPYLMAYHRSCDNDAALDFAREAIQSWLNNYIKTDTSYPFEFIWHDHATALRTEQLILFTYYCLEHAPDWVEQHSDFFVGLEHALLVHGEWLAKDSFYSKHTNHGLEQSRVLLLLSTVFEGEQSVVWQKVALARIKSELEFSFTSEGVHVENSPAYHIFVFKVFLGIVKDYPASILGDLATQFEQFSANALKFIAYILRPDGMLPPIGDTEQLPTSNSYAEMFAKRPIYQHFLYALNQGRQGIKPQLVNSVYPTSGYAIFRDQWPEADVYQQAFHIVMKLGCLSRYHHQQDEGHLSVYAWGEDWLIDSGLYNYVNTDPVRKYMRGRAGHNVPLINGVSYSKDFEHRLKNWKVTDFSDSNENPFVTLELQVLESVIQKRTFSFLGEIKRLCVADEFTFSDEGTHDITLQWHVPTDKKISIENDKVSIVSSAGAQCILTFEDEKPDQIVVLQGQKKDKVYSCISYKTNALESSQVIRVIFRSRPSLSVKSVFDFISEKTISSAVSNTTLHDVEVSSNAYKIDLPDYKTDYIQKFIAEHKAPYESEMLDAMAIGLKPMDLVLDVGANIGNHTLYWACVLGCQVRAFEPNERLYKPLMNSVELNGITHLVNVLPYGVGKVPSKARFTSFDETNLGSQSLQVVSDEEDASIEVVRLDDQVFESPVVAIKIDVEGMELAVLEGAEVLIQKDRPLLVIESVDTTHYESLRDFIKRNDYIYCSSFNGTPTHFFIHQDKVSGSPWINLFFEKGHEFYQMRHFHKKLKKTLQQLSKTKK